MGDKTKSARMGRPSKYKPEYCERLIEWMSQGKSFEAFGAEIDVTRDCLYKWCEQFPEFLYAKSKGKLKSLRYYEDLARDYIQGVQPNPQGSMLMFLLKCRFREFGYRDKFPDDPQETQVVVQNSSVDLSKQSTEKLVSLLIESKKTKSD